MKAFTRPFASVLKNKFSSQAAVKPAATGKANPLTHDVKVTRLQNGVMVASVENGCPVSRVAVLFNAGPRYESYDNQGVTHYIRAMSTQSSRNMSGFGLSRNLQQIGGNLSCTTNREQVMYTVETLRTHIDSALECLDSVANLPVFKAWEIGDMKPQLELEREIFEQSMDASVFEMIHKAAYRSGLGNSLYLARDKIGTLKTGDLEAFKKAHYVSENAAVVGIGIDHDFLVDKVMRFHFQKGHATEDSKAKYYGGELREDVRSNLVHVACVTEGIGYSSPELLPLSLLQHIIGVGPSIKYSTNQVSKLYKAAAAVATDPFAVSCISSNYSDSGLFGINLVSHAKDSGNILKSVFSIMNQAAKGKITDADLQRAKNHLKAVIHFYNENSEESLEWMGIEVLLSKQFISEAQIDGAIDKITLDEVATVAKKVITGKPSMAAIGNLSHTPYCDDLFAH